MKIDKVYTYDDLNRLVKIVDNPSPQPLKTIDYVFDNNGNTLSKKDSSLLDGDQTFTYDSRNQLIEVKRGPPGSEESLGKYDYNAEGLRVRHFNSERGNVTYFYDDNAVIEEHKADDNSLLAHYRYADRLISLETTVDVQYYHQDALGSTVDLTDQLGTLKVSYRLDAWGHIRQQVGDSVNRQIFTGQEHDFKTGLIYFGARFYDPDTARFITQDSYLGESTTPPSIHRYLYAYGNPTVFVDLEGYMSLESHREATRKALKIAIKNGDIQLPSGLLNLPNRWSFKRNLQIGAMLPDVQYGIVVKAIYWYSLKEMLPTEKGKKFVKKESEDIKTQVRETENLILKDISQQAYLTREAFTNWWEDSDIKQPAIEMLSKKYPGIKDLAIVQTHFYGKQWQHGMGEDQEAIQKQIIYDTVKRITSYQSYLANGDIENAARELGIVMHYLQDTWTPGHTARDASGDITYMYDFTKQSPTLHGQADEPESDSPTMQNAIKFSAELLKLINQYGNDPEAMERVLREKAYRLNYDKDHPNPYAPRANLQDVINAGKSCVDKALKPLNTSAQEIQKKIIDEFEKKRKLLNY